ncbi:phage portal protein [Clostridium scatologenes]|uniref:Phage portal protein, SPP1 Gp6 n=1 Tax=Clostridium scatologenes TaxID=1548 RepID=A0A0E3JY26_CLOSL|nr:phage portal protein [Clostridium scatologenes]AKA68537.1 phage portal protein, SPP1 Gp6 [Clostridium scatologenes]
MIVIRDIPDIIDSAVIDTLISYHKKNMLPKYQNMQKYYELHHDIENRTIEDSSKPNNKLINDYPGYIVNMCTGYFLGKPVAYSSKSNDDNYLNTLQGIFDYNDEADENAEIEKTCSIKGEAFELAYQDEEANTRFIQVPNEQIIVIYDITLDPKIKIAIRYYDVIDINNTTITKVEVYTADKISYYTKNSQGYVLDEEREHFFKEVPIIHYINNNEQMGDFERVISLIDAYDKQQSNTQNDFDYFTDAYLKIKNMSDTENSDITSMKENRVILIEGDGDADWLIKNVNDAALENYKNRLNKDIHKFSDVPDLSDESFAGDLSGVAIRFKLFCLEQIAAMKERKFKKALQRRIELITNILNIKGGNYTYTDIDMSFTRNIPANVTELVNMVTQLKGTLSEGTLIGQLPFVTDVQAEMDKIKDEQESTLDYNIPKANSNGNEPNNSSGDINE